MSALFVRRQFRVREVSTYAVLDTEVSDLSPEDPAFDDRVVGRGVRIATHVEYLDDDGLDWTVITPQEAVEELKAAQP
jgi:hypothetical protein